MGGNKACGPDDLLIEVIMVAFSNVPMQYELTIYIYIYIYIYI